MVIAVVAVTATVGIGTWVLGSGADAASPRPENSAPTATSVTRYEPPLSIAPPPSGDQATKATRKSAKVKTAKKPAAAGASAR
jgi:hypothetical protein